MQTRDKNTYTVQLTCQSCGIASVFHGTTIRNMFKEIVRSEWDQRDKVSLCPHCRKIGIKNNMTNMSCETFDFAKYGPLISPNITGLHFTFVGGCKEHGGFVRTFLLDTDDWNKDSEEAFEKFKKDGCPSTIKN